MIPTMILKFRRDFDALLRWARLEPIEITRHGRRAFVLMSAQHYDRITAAGRRAYRTTNATAVVINSVELAEMGASHAALEEQLNQTRRRASIQTPQTRLREKSLFATERDEISMP